MTLKSCCWAGLGLYAVLSAVDWVFTFALLRANPGAFESNPFAAACLERHGWGGLAVFKAGGVLAFAGAVALLIRRKPPVAAGVVAMGCVVLLGVTGYSHQLLAQTHRETGPSVAHPCGADLPVPERCWFAGDKRPACATPVQTVAVEAAER